MVSLKYTFLIARPFTLFFSMEHCIRNRNANIRIVVGIKEGFYIILDQLSDMMPSTIVGKGDASTDM